MQVTIIGSGNVATVLGRLLIEEGHLVTQVYSRSPAHAATLANQLQATAVSDLSLIGRQSDLYLLAVTDDALPAVAAALSLPGKLVLHTAGSVSKDILKKVSEQYGVLWPMKMIRRSMATLTPVTIVIDGSSETVCQQVERLAKIFSPLVVQAGDTLRIKMHMLAAVTSNFTNHLYHLAADYCSKEGIDFNLFYPLIEETARAIQMGHPKLFQAGPAYRGDGVTLEKHLQLLKQDPQLEKIYKVLSGSIALSFDPGTGKDG